ncbi:MAG: hypothetical protein ACYSTG_03810 [Planctomycetota bacterium]
MIKTLRITSIIAVVLAGGLLVFPAIFGLRSDKEIEDFLNLPSVVEKFRQDRGDDQKTPKDEISPLVAAAQAFGKYLNPPAPPRPRPRPTRAGPGKPTGVPAPPTPREKVFSAKFNLIATSVYAAQPELSLALIDRPGKGRQWVRQGSVVSHLTIEQVKDGAVVLKGAKETFEKRVVARPVQRSLIAGSSGVSLGTSGQSGSGPDPALVSAGAESVATTDTGTPMTGQVQISPEERAAMAARIFADMSAMTQRHGESTKTGSGPAAEMNPEGMQGILAEAMAMMRISSKEAKKLGDLGQELEGVGKDPNRPKSSKVEKSSKKPYKPRKSSKSKSTSQPTSKKRTKPKRRSGKH